MLFFYLYRLLFSSCHLAMGEVEVAHQYFSKCLESGADVCLDRRIIIEAANGLQTAQVPHLKAFFIAILVVVTYIFIEAKKERTEEGRCKVASSYLSKCCRS